MNFQIWEPSAAEEIGVEASYLAKIEKGAHSPRGKLRGKIETWLARPEEG